MRARIAVVAGVLGAAALVFILMPADPGAQAASGSTISAGCTDVDQDGYGLGCAAGPDCNDRDRTVNPGQSESCNLRDDDCNALVDDAAGCKAAPIDRRRPRVRIGGGRFLMGSAPGEGAADERPRHPVKISPFEIDRYEVTNRRYQRCVSAGRCKAPALASSARRAEYYGNPRFADYPVVFVGWAEAKAFCRFAGGRLPTEAEWELAARGRAPSTRTYPWGNARPDCSRANMGGPNSCVGDTDRVGRRPAGRSPFGVMDMAGNVWECGRRLVRRRLLRAQRRRRPQGAGAGAAEGDARWLLGQRRGQPARFVPKGGAARRLGLQRRLSLRVPGRDQDRCGNGEVTDATDTDRDRVVHRCQLAADRPPLRRRLRRWASHRSLAKDRRHS